MRCQDCNKFAAYDDSTEPEVSDLEVDTDGNVTGNIRIVLTHDECGAELKEGNFEVMFDAEAFKNTDGEVLDPAKHEDGDNHHLEVEQDDVELTSRTETTNPKTGKPINPRYAKTYYGYRLEVSMSCTCGSSWSAEATDDIQASSMDEL